jgi:ABC-2 type transport system ATP-binding protein
MVGAMTDPDVFHPYRSARNALRVLARASGVADPRVDVVLDQVGLTSAAGRRVGGFSMGMRQRLALAAALLGDPETLVLDEPANGLDPAGVHWLRQLLRGLAADGRTVFVSSHLLAELAHSWQPLGRSNGSSNSGHGAGVERIIGHRLEGVHGRCTRGDPEVAALVVV